MSHQGATIGLERPSGFKEPFQVRARLRLNLNYRKVKIIPVEEGIPFLGAVVSPDGRHLSRRSIRRIEHRRMDSLCREPNPFALQAIMNSYSGYLGHFNTNLDVDVK